MNTVKYGYRLTCGGDLRNRFLGADPELIVFSQHLLSGFCRGGYQYRVLSLWVQQKDGRMRKVEAFKNQGC